MLLTHEQAHAAYKIMELASAGGAQTAEARFENFGVRFSVHRDSVIAVDCENRRSEFHKDLPAFANAYDIDGCATLEKYRAAVVDWHAFCVYHQARSQPPCTREKFDSLSPAGRLTKMILGSWA